MAKPAVALTTEYILTLTALAAFGDAPESGQVSEQQMLHHLEEHAAGRTLITLTIRSTGRGVFILGDPSMPFTDAQVLDCFAGAVARASTIQASQDL